ncbi:hypothetical protein ZWY2020_054509 [Hordeum vulgare]|nr:hypothetical protein ZWY2020_054509 [Hordeum vulgare]
MTEASDHSAAFSHGSRSRSMSWRLEDGHAADTMQSLASQKLAEYSDGWLSLHFHLIHLLAAEKDMHTGGTVKKCSLHAWPIQ